MSKRILSMILAVCMLLSAPFALAQEDYVPGETMRSLISGALEDGQIVGGDLKLLFDMNMDVLDPSTLSVGVGKLDDGYRIELAGEYAPSGKQSTAIDAAIELTREGVVIESDLIEGKRLSATWESVLLMCGVPTDQIQQIQALWDADLEALVGQLSEQAKQAVEIIGQVAQPYANTVVDFLETLPADIAEDVEAEGIFPAVDDEVTITATDEDLSRLFVALLDQLESDETLVPLIDSLFVSSGAEGVDTAMLCEALRAEAEAFARNGNNYTLMLGINDEGLAGYCLFDVTGADAQSDTFSVDERRRDAGESELRVRAQRRSGQCGKQRLLDGERRADFRRSQRVRHEHEHLRDGGRGVVLHRLCDLVCQRGNRGEAARIPRRLQHEHGYIRR